MVAKGYNQTNETDYLETFAPVAKMNIVWVLLSLATQFAWNLQQFDIENIFLHDDLEEEFFMELLLGFDETIGPNKVCQLKKLCMD